MSAMTRIDYSDGETPLIGHLVRPTGTPRAAVAVFPTFMNITEGVANKARALADAGYTAFVADFYGPESPHDFDSANSAMMRLRADPHAMRTRLRATLTKLGELEPGVPQVAIGFCLGGLAVLELARDGADLELVASFHGLLQTPLPAAQPIKPRILVCHGDVDFLVPRSHVKAFWEEMDAVQANWHFHSYARVDHGFTNPLTPVGEPNPAYNASADRQSWAALMGLLDEVLA
ncbi:dienelactone hydrolase family protein [Novosphingobium sp.]|uniref:dienelactone hydrolase family protein n=1 Tax=Novosphingobium sp. TaxID=1874826 RepID=UPI0022BDA2C8|nr:dienelactone hydrolase family protein [Novosphingobium sp.]MCZ8017288.1 dienelactone hydrolase family protein [Novosphingobium sp.]MCZ8034189.1 dienelactone hydrolase family protein [Novosphingobium sp.]MCZ8051544.1 dienelactone hydrolase family protein [Novosphingobium sp.]MCZ8059890.1 dienelactone hydrolase family protein [Novosphingobium sp.]MCZ8231728.1 dienelactone hydrolase family protein [Novosphingobium sp.]